MKNRNKRFTSVLAATMALGTVAPAFATVAPVFATEEGTDTDVQRTLKLVEDTQTGYIYTEPTKIPNTTVVGGKTQWQTTLFYVPSTTPGINNITIPSKTTLSLKNKEDGTMFPVGSGDVINVTGIADYAFYDNENIGTVTIPSSIKTIGEYAFADSGLTSVTINGNAKGTTIEEGAFAGNIYLTTVNLSNVKTINKNAFKDDINLSTLTLAKEKEDILKTINDSAFEGCASLTTVTLPSSVTTIATNAFKGTKIKGEINLPASLKTMGENAFATNSVSGALTLILPVNDDGKNPSITWTASVFGLPAGQPENVKSLFKIIGVSETEPTWLQSDAQFYIAVPNVKATAVDKYGTVSPVSANSMDKQKLQVVVGDSVLLDTTQIGKLFIDGKEVKNYPTANNTYKWVTPALGEYTVTFENASGIKSYPLTVMVVESMENYWIDADIDLPEEWHIGQTVDVTVKSAYGTPYYVYSDTKTGVYSKDVPTKTGWYWVKAVVDAKEGEYNSLESAPVRFQMLPELPKTGWNETANGWQYLEAGVPFADGLKVVGKDTYFFKGGIMQTGWEVVDGSYMFFDKEGHAKNEWLNDNGTWYYFKDLKMVTNKWVSDKGKEYFVDEKGCMAASQWLKKDGKWVYVDNSGAIKKGWLGWNMNWYYLDPTTGYMWTSGTVDGWNIQSNGVAVKA